MPNTVPDHEYTNRQYRLMRSLQRTGSWDETLAEVNAWFAENPDADPDELHTYDQWTELLCTPSS